MKTDVLGGFGGGPMDSYVVVVVSQDINVGFCDMSKLLLFILSIWWMYCFSHYYVYVQYVCRSILYTHYINSSFLGGKPFSRCFLFKRESVYLSAFLSGPKYILLK